MLTLTTLNVFYFLIFILGFLCGGCAVWYKTTGLKPEEEAEIRKKWAEWLKENPEFPPMRSLNRF